MNIYIVGSLRNPEVPEIASRLRLEGHDVFDDWFAAGPEADDWWRDYEQKHRGHGIRQALKGFAAQHVFKFDRHHLLEADVVILWMPGGKSAHLETGWAAGIGYAVKCLGAKAKPKKTYILFDKEPERFDVMYAFMDDVFTDVEELAMQLRGDANVEKWARIAMDIGHTLGEVA